MADTQPGQRTAAGNTVPQESRVPVPGVRPKRGTINRMTRGAGTGLAQSGPAAAIALPVTNVIQGLVTYEPQNGITPEVFWGSVLAILFVASRSLGQAIQNLTNDSDEDVK